VNRRAPFPSRTLVLCTHPIDGARGRERVRRGVRRLDLLRVASAEEVDAHLRAVAAGQLDIATPPLVSASGRRPGAPVE
jgi:hypothetical protein